ADRVGRDHDDCSSPDRGGGLDRRGGLRARRALNDRGAGEERCRCARAVLEASTLGTGTPAPTLGASPDAQPSSPDELELPPLAERSAKARDDSLGGGDGFSARRFGPPLIARRLTTSSKISNLNCCVYERGFIDTRTEGKCL